MRRHPIRDFLHETPEERQRKRERKAKERAEYLKALEEQQREQRIIDEQRRKEREAERKERQRLDEIKREEIRNRVHFLNMAKYPGEIRALCDESSSEFYSSSPKSFKTFTPESVTCPKCLKKMKKTGIIEWGSRDNWT